MENININQEQIIDTKSKKKEYNLTYYTKHKTKLLEKLKEKKTCTDCDKFISLSNFSRHKKTCKKLNTIGDCACASI